MVERIKSRNNGNTKTVLGENAKEVNDSHRFYFSGENRTRNACIHGVGLLHQQQKVEISIQCNPVFE